MTPNTKTSPANAARITIQRAVDALQLLLPSVQKQFPNAVNILNNASNRIIVTGMGKSGHVAKKCAATLASTGSPASFVHPAEAGHGDLGMITPNDALLAFSHSGETPELANVLQHAVRFNIPLVAVTSNPKSPLAAHASSTLLLPKSLEADQFNLAPTTSTTLQIVLGDALAVALLHLKNFSPSQFRQLHPGGSLGAQLQLVKHLMQSDNLPILNQNDSMQNAVISITRSRLGCLGALNDEKTLVGVVTDGDLRRHMSPNLLSLPISSVMTKNPQTISPNALAVEALRTLNTKRISSLFVVNQNNQPVGVVHLHHLLSAGVA